MNAINILTWAGKKLVSPFKMAHNYLKDKKKEKKEKGQGEVTVTVDKEGVIRVKVLFPTNE